MNGIALRRRLAKQLVPQGDGIGSAISGRKTRPFFGVGCARRSAARHYGPAVTAKYTNPDPSRGRFSATMATCVGLQSYANYAFTTAFRNIRLTAL